MKATIKHYLDSNPELLSPVPLKVRHLLKVNKVKPSKIAALNIHNYIKQVEGT